MTGLCILEHSPHQITVYSNLFDKGRQEINHLSLILRLKIKNMKQHSKTLLESLKKKNYSHLRLEYVNLSKENTREQIISIYIN